MFPLKRCLLSLLRAFSLAMLLAGLTACDEQAASPTPLPSPSPRPSPTPSLQQAVDGSMFTISFNGTLLATEEISVDSSGNQPIVFSEIRQIADSAIERRTMVLAPDYGPIQYELERNVLGVRSTWTIERTDDAIDGLGNNLDWYGPVLIEGVSPSPDVILESAPSALPFVLLALRSTDNTTQTPQSMLHLLTMDVIEGLGATRPMTITTAPDRKGAVIGTSALEGHIDGGANPRFTLWIRPGNRALYSVEIADYRFDPWQARTHPMLRQPGTLVIQRVSRLPEPTTVTPEPGSDMQALNVSFVGGDGTARAGTLALPTGSGPFPVLVAHSASGVVPRSGIGDAFVPQGWAIYSYDKRGLGESEGEFERGPGAGLVEDAVAAAAMLAERQDIDPQRIVFLGIGDGGLVGAQVMATESHYAGAILGSAATATRIFPDLAQERLRTVLARHYGWTDRETSFYANQSANRWEAWLVEGRDDVAAARRRVSVASLRDWGDIDLAGTLLAARVPILLLHGEEDRWTPVAGARAIQESLQAQGNTQITLRIYPGLDDSLSTDDAPGVLAAPVQEAILAWLETLPK